MIPETAMQKKIQGKGVQKMELEYRQEGDYLVPDIEMDAQPEGEIRKYGLLRKNYLEENKGGVFTAMVLSNRLAGHLLMVQGQAEERMDILIKQMAEAEGVDGTLEAEDQMLWLQKMENIRQRAEEIVLEEIIYS